MKSNFSNSQKVFVEVWSFAGAFLLILGVFSSLLFSHGTVNALGGGPPPPINKPEVTLTASPESIVLGESSTLSWTSLHANSCEALWTDSVSTSGSASVSPSATTTFSIKCVGDGGSKETSVVVNVSIPPPSCDIPVWTSSESLGGKVGEVFTHTFNATSSHPSEVIFSLATSSLPTGIAFDEVDTISGTLSEEGESNLVVTASNDCGDAEVSIKIIVSPADVVTPPAEEPENGGGGSSSGGGGSKSGDRVRSPGTFSVPSLPSVLGASTDCEYLKDYLKIGWINSEVEMIKLQVFLKIIGGSPDLVITGVFDKATFNAVSIFQEKYFSDILEPWGHDKSTGFVYILTKKKINELVCNTTITLTSAQEAEIKEFRAFLGSLGVRMSTGGSGITGPVSNVPRVPGDSILSPKGVDFALNRLNGGRIDGDDVGLISATNTELVLEDSKFRSVAAAVLAGPQGKEESLNAIIAFVTIILALYLLARVLVDRQVSSSGVTIDSQKTRKQFYFLVGLALVTLGSIALGFYNIVLPLIALVVVVAILLIRTVLQSSSSSLLIVKNDTEEEMGTAGLREISEILNENPSAQKVGWGMVDKQWETTEEPDWSKVEEIPESEGDSPEEEIFNLDESIEDEKNSK